MSAAGTNWSPEALLSAINAARGRSLPEAAPFELIQAYSPLGMGLGLGTGGSSGGGALGAQAAAATAHGNAVGGAAPLAAPSVMVHPQPAQATGVRRGAGTCGGGNCGRWAQPRVWG